VYSLDIGAALLRLTLGMTMIAHGWNHALGGGGLAGTTRWFASIGMRQARVNALTATAAELGAGALVVLGLATPLATAAVVGTMLVALATNHLRNGFFIFRPGEGYEYILMIIITTCALAALGPGSWSLDHLIGLSLNGWFGLGICAVLGGIAAIAVLAVFWRPAREATQVADTTFEPT
jgi:putative oxidoreductase